MSRKRTATGAAFTAEGAAVLVFGLPLLVLLVFVTMELCQFYTIKSAMDIGARNAARDLVVAYNNNGTASTSIDLTSMTSLKMPRYIMKNNQFSVAWDSTTAPTQVSVTCSYPNGGDPANGLPQFPWGPLQYIGKRSNFSMTNFAVAGKYTMPVQ